MISCKKAAELMSKAKEQELSFGEKLALKFRIGICYLTKRYYNQIESMSDCLKRDCGCSEQDFTHASEKCSEDFKAKLKSQLQEKE